MALYSSGSPVHGEERHRTSRGFRDVVLEENAGRDRVSNDEVLEKNTGKNNILEEPY